jgi:paraquat-inducible protein B
MWLGISQLQRRTTPVYFYFDETVNGLEIGSPVKFRGVTIGGVDEILPAPDRRNIEVRSGLYVDRLENFGIALEELKQSNSDRSFVSDDLRAQLVTSALTSVSFIQIDVFDPPPPRPTYTFPTPWETIPTTPSTFKSLERGIMEALDSFPRLSAQVETLLERLNQGVEDLQLATLSQDLSELLGSGEKLMTELRTSPLVDKFSDTFAKLDRMMLELGDLAAELNGPDGQVERVVQRFDSVGAAVQADFEGSDIPGAVEALKGAGHALEGTNQEVSSLLRDVRGGLDRFQVTLAALQELALMLSRDPGALLHGRSYRPLPFDR